MLFLCIQSMKVHSSVYWRKFFAMQQQDEHWISYQRRDENILKVSHFCSKKVMYNKYYNM
jgi:hypothetical protein